MAVEVKIGGVAYSATDGYQIRQQAGAVSSSSIAVRVDAQAVPQPLQSAQVLINSVPVFYGIIVTVEDPERSTGFEPGVYGLELQSMETILNFRLINRNWYNKYIHEIVADIFASYLAEEGITLGTISTTTVQIAAYRKSYSKASEILDDLVGRLDGATYYITPDKKFHFVVRSDFPSVAAPEHITGLKRTRSYGDLRTVQIVRGASAGIVGTSTNTTLKGQIATLAGTSGKIEKLASDSTIHNPGAAAGEAADALTRYAENETTVRCSCSDLTKSAVYTEWVVPGSGSAWPVPFAGSYVVTERTITSHGSGVLIAVTLKNRNFLARYGYAVRAAAQAAGTAIEQITEVADDDLLTPDKKVAARGLWNTTVAERTALNTEADSVYVTTEKATYNAAFQALADYLNAGSAWTTGVPAWLADDRLSRTEDIDGDEYRAKWDGYLAAKIALSAAITSARTTITVGTAGQQVPAFAPRYRGPFLYPDKPGDPKRGDRCLSFSATSGDAYRGVFVFNPDASPTWTRTVEPADLSDALRDIADIAVSGTYGTEADYGVTTTAIAHIRAALIDILKAGTIEVRGKIYALEGYFSGKLDAPEIKTQQAQTPGVITPAGAWWKGSRFTVDRCAGFPLGNTDATGTFDGKTVDYVRKGDSTKSYPYQSADAENQTSSGYWTSLKSIVSTVRGEIAACFSAKVYQSNIVGGVRILHNGAVIATWEPGAATYHYINYSTLLTVSIGDTIEIQAHAGFFLWTAYPSYVKDLRLCAKTGTVGVVFTDASVFVIAPDTYYQTAGNIYPSGAADFITSTKLEYWLGVSLSDVLLAAGAKIYSEIELEEDGWSETYGALIYNVFAGKSCSAYKVEPGRTTLYNADATTTVIEDAVFYTYASGNKLYPQERNGSVKIGGYKYETGNHVAIQREENTVDSGTDSHFSVKSLDAPRVDNVPAAKFESTRAKSISWHDGIWHEQICDDSLHNLIEETSSLTINTTNKYIERSTAFSRGLVTVGEWVRLYGFVTNPGCSGYYRVVRAAGARLYYDSTLLATPVSCTESATLRYPPKQVWALVNAGSSSDTHAPRFSWAYVKSGVTSFWMDLIGATKRLWVAGGRSPTGYLFATNSTKAEVFTALFPVLAFTGEEMLLHGSMSRNVDGVEYPMTVFKCVRGPDYVEIHGFSVTSHDVDAVTVTEGDMTAMRVAISW